MEGKLNSLELIGAIQFKSNLKDIEQTIKLPVLFTLQTFKHSRINKLTIL